MAESIAIRRATAVERSFLTIVAAAALCVPLSFGTYYNIEFNPAYLLAPLIAYAMWQCRDEWTTRTFMISCICGLVSIFAVHSVAPGNLKGNIAELLIWMLFAPSSLFLGRCIPLKSAVYWTATLSAAFLIVVTVPLLITGSAVREAYTVASNGHGIGTSYLNIQVLGLPVYATFGVNSITPLFCIQAALLCGGIYTVRQPLMTLLAVGLVCATILTIESDSRTGQATLILLGIAVAVFAIRNRELRARSLVIILAFLSAAPIIAMRGMDEGRLITAVYDTAGLVGDGGKSSPGKFADVIERTDKPKEKSVSTVTTGRTTLWDAVLTDLTHSPIFGNGFAGFGRFFPAPNAEGNTTAHLYFLTIPWKGGILFSLPFFAFIGLALWSAWRARDRSPEWFFSATGVALMFLLPSLTWDILMIPSAGALAWLLLGSLGADYSAPTRTG